MSQARSNPEAPLVGLPFTPPAGEEAFLRWALQQPHAAFLDSGAKGYSSLRWGPSRVATFETLAEGELDAWIDESSQLGASDKSIPTPHLPGVITYAGYEAARFFEPELPAFQAQGPEFPTIWAADYPWSLVRSPSGVWQAFARQPSDLPTYFESEKAMPAPKETKAELRALWSKADYLAAFDEVMARIRDGVFYEANLTQRFVADDDIDAVEAYLRLRESSKPAWGAFLDLGEGRKLLSSSPECFLRAKGRQIATEPIKGTRPRHADQAKDEALAAELAANTKEHAELTMVVDMLRNDLARVSVAGSVKVPKHAEVMSLTHVHHMRSEITAMLKEETSFQSLLAATFPGGSITGAPKFSVISELSGIELQRRGPYTGSIFAIGANGDLLSNILIRTIILEPGRVSFNTGGGIVADSRPEAEYLECFQKAKGMLAALAPELDVRNLSLVLDSAP